MIAYVDLLVHRVGHLDALHALFAIYLPQLHLTSHTHTSQRHIKRQSNEKESKET